MGKLGIILTAVLCASLPTPLSLAAQGRAAEQSGPVVRIKRLITVADAIRMVRFADPYYTKGGLSKGIVAHFSPDKKRFIVVVRRGNLQKNTNEYSILLFRTAEAFHSPKPEVLLTMSSSSNREAIKSVSWLADSDTIVFLGEGPGQLTQLYSLQCSSGALKALTNHPSNLSSYQMTARGELIVYSAERRSSSLINEQERRNGIHVSTQLLSDLVIGSVASKDYDDHELFMTGTKFDLALPLHKQGRIPDPVPTLALAPDGKYLVVKTEVPKFPDSWEEYENSLLRLIVRSKPLKGSLTRIFRYELIDTHTRTSQVLLDAPLGTLGGSEIVWSPDSHSVVVAGTYLPLSVSDPVEREARKARTFVAEIKIPGKEVMKVTDQDLRLIGWDSRTNLVQFEVGRVQSLTTNNAEKVFYQRTLDRWRQVGALTEASSSDPPEIILQEDVNTPPRLVAVSPKTGEKSLLWDLNPQFNEFSFGKVEGINWKGADGDEIKAGLYFPPDYIAGTKYPLIIQTHGFDPDRFWIDGPWTTAFAAQPLANRGFLVLQVPDPPYDLWDTPREPARAMTTYEEAIAHLDARGLMDSARVGLLGFSRACLYVKYALTHSKHRFAAASVTDGIDGGYFQYIAFSNALPPFASEIAGLNGSQPFGDGLSSWVEVSPGFLMHKVRTPLRIVAIGPMSLLTEWEWFSGLSKLGRLVDMVYLPDGTHILQKPWERLVSQQGNVDWFAFWLKGEEDPDPAKAEQYARWRELRTLQQQNAAKAKAAAPN